MSGSLAVRSYREMEGSEIGHCSCFLRSESLSVKELSVLRTPYSPATEPVPILVHGAEVANLLYMTFTCSTLVAGDRPRCWVRGRQYRTLVCSLHAASELSQPEASVLRTLVVLVQALKSDGWKRMGEKSNWLCQSFHASASLPTLGQRLACRDPACKTPSEHAVRMSHAALCSVVADISSAIVCRMRIHRSVDRENSSILSVLHGEGIASVMTCT